MRKLFYGDNLDVMREHVPSDYLDLVYLDPPFKSDADYNILFKADGLSPDEAQMTAFKDTWIWDEAAERTFDELMAGTNYPLVTLIQSLRTSLTTSPMMAYLVNMAARLQEIHRTLKPGGSIYLHCDPTASHYLKIIMDAVFDPTNFLNEIVWRRTGAHNKSIRWGPIHDNILFYKKAGANHFWNNVKIPYMMGHVQDNFVSDGKGGYRTNYYGNVLTGSGTRGGESGDPWRGVDPTAKGRHWAIPGAIWEEAGIDPTGMGQHEKLEALYKAGFIKFTPGQYWPVYEMAVRPGSGPAAPDIWAYQPYTSGTVFGTKDCIDEDVRWLNPRDMERLGFPTQKPVGMLKRIIAASCPKNGIVMDPFCGCGTTIEAAESLGMNWIGIDISPFAIQLVKKARVQGAFPDLKEGTDYTITGLPTTLAGAVLLAEEDKKAFEVWCVGLLDGIPNPKKGADSGIDGRIPFRPDGKQTRFAVISVKGGKLKADDIRSLVSVAAREKANSLGFGVFVSLFAPTKGMLGDAAAAGLIEVLGKKYQAIQIITVEELLHGKRPKLPLVDVGAAYKRAKVVSKIKQETMF